MTAIIVRSEVPVIPTRAGAAPACVTLRFIFGGGFEVEVADPLGGGPAKHRLYSTRPEALRAHNRAVARLVKEAYS